jgi:uncharacterized membrane protein
MLVVLALLIGLVAAVPTVVGPTAVEAGYYCEAAKANPPYTVEWYAGWTACLVEIIQENAERWL